MDSKNKFRLKASVKNPNIGNYSVMYIYEYGEILWCRLFIYSSTMLVIPKRTKLFDLSPYIPINYEYIGVIIAPASGGEDESRDYMIACTLPPGDRKLMNLRQFTINGNAYIGQFMMNVVRDNML